MKTQQRSTSLNEGIQLLRVVAMNGIIAIHLLGKGGLFDAAIPGSSNAWFLLLLRSVVCASVNCYVLISGYFLWDKPFKMQRITRTVSATMLYSVIMSIIAYLFGGVLQSKT